MAAGSARPAGASAGSGVGTAVRRLAAAARRRPCRRGRASVKSRPPWSTVKPAALSMLVDGARVALQQLQGLRAVDGEAGGGGAGIVEAQGDLDPAEIGGLQIDPHAAAVDAVDHHETRGHRPAAMIGRGQLDRRQAGGRIGAGRVSSAGTVRGAGLDRRRRRIRWVETRTTGAGAVRPSARLPRRRWCGDRGGRGGRRPAPGSSPLGLRSAPARSGSRRCEAVHGLESLLAAAASARALRRLTVWPRAQPAAIGQPDRRTARLRSAGRMADFGRPAALPRTDGCGKALRRRRGHIGAVAGATAAGASACSVRLAEASVVAGGCGDGGVPVSARYGRCRGDRRRLPALHAEGCSRLGRRLHQPGEQRQKRVVAAGSGGPRLAALVRRAPGRGWAGSP